MNAGLYYEDIEIGDEIGPIERIVTLEQVRAFLAIRSERSGLTRFTDDAQARSEGLPGAIVPGAINTAMMAQLLTGWSSTVTLKKLDVSFRQVVCHNTRLELKGVVTARQVIDQEAQVECDIFMENEDGALHVIGQAIVVLPRRVTAAP
jgi:acyl dehydratase